MDDQTRQPNPQNEYPTGGYPANDYPTMQAGGYYPPTGETTPLTPAQLPDPQTPPAEPGYQAYQPYPTAQLPTSRPGRRRGFLIGAIALTALALLLIGGGVAIAAAQRSTPAQAVATATTAAPANSAKPHGWGELTVTQVSGSTIMATMKDGSVVTITTTAQTIYMKQGQRVDASAVTVGKVIRVEGKKTGEHAVTAKAITVVVPGQHTPKGTPTTTTTPAQ